MQSNIATEGADREVVDLTLTLVAALLKYVLLGHHIFPQAMGIEEPRNFSAAGTDMFHPPVRRKKGAVDEAMVQDLIRALLQLLKSKPMYMSAAEDIIGTLSYNCTEHPSSSFLLSP